MAKLPKEWRVYARGDPDGQFRRYRTLVNQYKSAEARRQRIRQLRRAFRQTALWGLILAAIVALGWRMLTLKPLPPPPPPSAWPAEIRATHMAASRSCDAARAAGLAPATRGYPGYWPHHDRDNDGVACEWSFGLPSISLRWLMGGE